MSEIALVQLREKVRKKKQEIESAKSELYLLERELERAISKSPLYQSYQLALRD